MYNTSISESTASNPELATTSHAPENNIPLGAKGAKIDRFNLQAENAGHEGAGNSSEEERKSSPRSMWDSFKRFSVNVIEGGKSLLDSAKEKFNTLMKNPVFAFVVNTATLPGRAVLEAGKFIGSGIVKAVNFIKENPKLAIGIALAVAATVIPGAAVLALVYNAAMNVETAVDVVKAVASGDFKTAALLVGVTVAAVVLGPVLGRAAASLKGVVKNGATVVKDAAKSVTQKAAAKLMGKEFSDLAKMGTKELAEHSVNTVGAKIAADTAVSSTGIIEQSNSLITHTSEVVANKVVASVETEVVELSKTLGATSTNTVRVTADQVKEIASSLKEKAKEVSEKEFSEMLDKIGLKDDISDKVGSAFQKIGTGTSRSSERYLMKELGFTQDEARYYVKGMREALNNANGAYNEKIKNAIAADLEAKISKQLKDAAGPAFDQKMEEGLVRVFKKHHLELEDDALKSLKKSAKEGFEEGIEKAVKKIVHDAIEAALKKYRIKERGNALSHRVESKRATNSVHEASNKQENKSPLLSIKFAPGAGSGEMRDLHMKGSQGQKRLDELSLNKNSHAMNDRNSFLIGNIAGYNDATEFKVLHSQEKNAAGLNESQTLKHVSSNNKDPEVKAVSELVAAVKPSQKGVEVRLEIVEGSSGKKVA